MSNRQADNNNTTQDERLTRGDDGFADAAVAKRDRRGSNRLLLCLIATKIGRNQPMPSAQSSRSVGLGKVKRIDAAYTRARLNCRRAVVRCDTNASTFAKSARRRRCRRTDGRSGGDVVNQALRRAVGRPVDSLVDDRQRTLTHALHKSCLPCTKRENPPQLSQSRIRLPPHSRRQ